MMNLDFTGKNAIIVGAASGIGKGIAQVFAENNANIWIADLDEDKGNKAVEELKSISDKTFGFTKVDVSKKEDLEALFLEATKNMGNIDMVVNSAGVFAPFRFLEATPEAIDKHLGINLMGVVYGCQIAMDLMIKQGTGGKILNVSSVGGRHGESGFPFYALGKSGVLNITQSCALIGAEHGINVNAICPGIIRTPMWDTILKTVDPDADPAELYENIVAGRIPQGKAQTAEDMGFAAAFLCSDYASVITGQALNVSGGEEMN